MSRVQRPYLRTAFLIALCFVAGLAAVEARAADEDWRVKIGGGVMLAPDYEGSDDYELKPLPDVEISYRKTLTLKNTALSYDLMRPLGGGADSAWRFGPRARYAFGRDQDDNDALRGLGDVNGSIELGGFVGYGVGPWSTELSVMQDVGDGHEGLTAELQGGYAFRFTPRLGGRLGVSMTYADETYMQSFFGVTPLQSARSGYAVEQADAGLKDVGLMFGLNYGLTENWALGGFLGYKRLLSDAADSQIVDQEGSANQFRTGVTLSYKF